MEPGRLDAKWTLRKSQKFDSAPRVLAVCADTKRTLRRATLFFGANQSSVAPAPNRVPFVVAEH
jgi:hypothetical protein